MGRVASTAVEQVLDGAEVQEILRDGFFVSGVSSGGDTGGSREPPPRAPARRVGAAKPDHYKVICISLYIEDLRRVDDAVRELKRRGYTKANRSAVIRVAMSQLELDRVPRGL